MSIIEGLLPAKHITAERAARRTLLIVSEVRLLREGIAESIEGNSGLAFSVEVYWDVDKRIG